jgi:hypothetical protein
MEVFLYNENYPATTPPLLGVVFSRDHPALRAPLLGKEGSSVVFNYGCVLDKYLDWGLGLDWG